MSAYAPCGLSFRALTILIEHIENGGDYPIIHHQAVTQVDSNRNVSTARLIDRGYLRIKNSKYTTITRYGHNKFLEAAAAWADFLTRAELAKLNGTRYTLRQFNEETGRTTRGPSDAEAMARRRRNSMAYWESETLPPERADTL